MQTKEIYEQFLQQSALKEEDVVDYRYCTPFYAGLYIPNAITIQLKNNKEIIFLGNEESALRDKLLVGAGVIASELHAMGLISFPCGDVGEEELSSKFIAAACDKYINEKINIPFDLYIADTLRDEYGGVWKQLREEYEECDTKCDKCLNLNRCVTDGVVMECTRRDDMRKHYIVSLGVSCPGFAGDRKYAKYAMREE